MSCVVFWIAIPCSVRANSDLLSWWLLYFSHSSRQSFRFAVIQVPTPVCVCSLRLITLGLGFDSIEPRGEDSIDVAVPDDDTGRARATRLPRTNVRLLVLMWQSESVIKQD